VKGFRSSGGAEFLGKVDRHPATSLRLFWPQTREASARIVEFLKAVAAGDKSTPSDEGGRDERDQDSEMAPPLEPEPPAVGP
jgi:hypothetical protein